MNAAQIHLALNHAPLFLSLIGGGILILGMIRKNESLKSLSLYLLVAGAILTAPVFLTGEGTEEMIEHLPGVSENVIEKHEDMAKIALLIIILTGTLALAGLIFKKIKAFSRIVFPVTVLLSLVSFLTMAQTAHLGGLIRHSEIQTAGELTTEKNENESGDQEPNNAIRPEETAVQDSLKQTEKVKNKKEEDDD